MAVYTKRVQTVLTEEQFEELAELSEKLNKPLSVLVREAVERYCLEPANLERRMAALRELLSLNAPVADWEQMEDEITRGRYEE